MELPEFYILAEEIYRTTVRYYFSFYEIHKNISAIIGVNFHIVLHVKLHTVQHSLYNATFITISEPSEEGNTEMFCFSVAF